MDTFCVIKTNAYVYTTNAVTEVNEKLEGFTGYVLLRYFLTTTLIA